MDSKHPMGSPKKPQSFYQGQFDKFELANLYMHCEGLSKTKVHCYDLNFESFSKLRMTERCSYNARNEKASRTSTQPTKSTFLLGASFGGSRITISQDSPLAIAFFIKCVASSFTNDNTLGSRLLRTTFSWAISKEGEDESTPSRGKRNIRQEIQCNLR